MLPSITNLPPKTPDIRRPKGGPTDPKGPEGAAPPVGAALFLSRQDAGCIRPAHLLPPPPSCISALTHRHRSRYERQDQRQRFREDVPRSRPLRGHGRDERGD